MSAELADIDPMVQNMGKRVAGMRGLPDLKRYRPWELPGERMWCREGEVFYDTVKKSNGWEKIDKVIIKALNALNAKGIPGSLGLLQEASFLASVREDNVDSGVHFVALRLMDTRHKVETFGRLRLVSQGIEEPCHSDRLFYGDGPWEDIIASIAVVLRERGILQKKKQPEQEQENDVTRTGDQTGP